MNLYEEIQTMRSAFLQQVPDKTIAQMENATKRLTESGIEKKCLSTGELAPSFKLPNAFGEIISSNDLLEKGHLVISFYRGGWCPYCNLELKALQERVSQIEELGATLIAISPNLPDKSMGSINQHTLSFEVLSDLHNTVARKFGLVYTLDEELQSIYSDFGIDIPEFNGDDTYDIPIPATYIVHQNGLIVKAFVDADYSKRLEPAEVIETLKKIQ